MSRSICATLCSIAMPNWIPQRKVSTRRDPRDSRWHHHQSRCSAFPLLRGLVPAGMSTGFTARLLQSIIVCHVGIRKVLYATVVSYNFTLLYWTRSRYHHRGTRVCARSPGVFVLHCAQLSRSEMIPQEEVRGFRRASSSQFPMVHTVPRVSGLSTRAWRCGATSCSVVVPSGNSW